MAKWVFWHVTNNRQAVGWHHYSWHPRVRKIICTCFKFSFLPVETYLSTSILLMIFGPYSETLLYSFSIYLVHILVQYCRCTCTDNGQRREGDTAYAALGLNQVAQSPLNSIEKRPTPTTVLNFRRITSPFDDRQSRFSKICAEILKLCDQI